MMRTPVRRKSQDLRDLVLRSCRDREREGIMPCRDEIGRQERRKVLVEQELHAGRRSGNSRS